MKRILLVAALLAACGKYKAPPSVPSVAMPVGAALKPFDAAKPSLARPSTIHLFNGKAYVTLGNYDDGYVARGPGMLAVVTPTTGAVSIIDLGGANEKQCLEPFAITDAGGKLYVACSGYKDYSVPGSTLIGTAIVEVDPVSGAVTRSVATPVGPAGLAITSGKIWFADASSAHLYALDRGSFTITGDPLSIPCAATGTGPGQVLWVFVSNVIVVQGDLYAACSNSNGGVLSRLDASTGAAKAQVDAGPTAAAFTETGDGRIAIVSGGDNKLRLVTLGQGALTVAEAYTYGGSTSTLQDVQARDNFLFTAASGSNTVQKLDLTKTGAAMLVGEANVGLSASPYAIVPLDDDQALVANQSSNTVVSVGADCTGGKLCWTKPK
jgi:hypothetical protein